MIMFSEQAFLNAGPLIVRGLQGAGGGRLHLQRADDRAGAAAALPGGLDQHPPPPHQPAHLDRPRLASANSTARCAVVLLGIAAFTAFVARRRPDRRPEADADRLRRQVHLRPRRAAAGDAAGWGSTWPRSRSTRPASRRARCGAPPPAGSAAPPSSSPGTSCPLVSDEFRRVEIGFLLAAGVLFAPALPRLPPPARTPRGRARAGLAGGARGAAGGDRRERVS